MPVNTLEYLRICLLRLLRDPAGLVLTLATAPLFTLFFRIVFHDARQEFTFAVIDNDRGIQTAKGYESCGDSLISFRREAAGANTVSEIGFVEVSTEGEALAMMRRGEADGMISIPPLFSQECRGENGAVWRFTLRKEDPLAAGAALFLDGCNERFNSLVLRNRPQVRLEPIERPDDNPVSPFDAFAPGLIVFAVIMLVFSVSGAVAREIESGGFTRLRMSLLTPVQLIGGLGIVHFVVGFISIAATWMTITLTGFHFDGNTWAVLLLGSLATLSAMAVGIGIASVARSRHTTLLVACMAMFVAVLFSGVIFPVPQVNVLTVRGTAVSLFDLLPTVHLQAGLSGMLLRSARLGDLAYHFYALALSSVILSVAATCCMNHCVFGERNT